jgi:hypothetical protein
LKTRAVETPEVAIGVEVGVVARPARSSSRVVARVAAETVACGGFISLAERTDPGAQTYQHEILIRAAETSAILVVFGAVGVSIGGRAGTLVEHVPVVAGKTLSGGVAAGFTE